MKYKKYHPAVKMAYALGMEQRLLPAGFRNSIAPATSFHWRQDNPKDYLGSEFADGMRKDLTDLQLLADPRIIRTRRMFMAICRVQITLITLFGKDQFKTLMQRHRVSVSALIDQVGESLGGTKTVCRHFMLSHTTFTTWKRYQHLQCPSSPINLCFKKVPMQIPYKEIAALKTYMANPRYAHWSIASVWGLCFKKGQTTMSRSTWYRYCKTLGVSSSRRRAKLKKKRGSVQATAPNQIWHADVTYVKSADHVRFYVYTVVDNFSRKILAYTVSNKLSGKIRIESLKHAIRQEFGVHIPGRQHVDLIVDGGSENNNRTVADFIKSCHVQIDKKIALKDVHFSNSVVEGSYRIMKQSYLRLRSIHSTDFKQQIDEIVTDLNDHKPHYVHQIYTPSEVHHNPALKDLKPQSRPALGNRVSENQKFGCIKGC